KLLDVSKRFVVKPLGDSPHHIAYIRTSRIARSIPSRQVQNSRSVDVNIGNLWQLNEIFFTLGKGRLIGLYRMPVKIATAPVGHKGRMVVFLGPTVVVKIQCPGSRASA